MKYNILNYHVLFFYSPEFSKILLNFIMRTTRKEIDIKNFSFFLYLKNSNRVNEFSIEPRMKPVPFSLAVVHLHWVRSKESLSLVQTSFLFIYLFIYFFFLLCPLIHEMLFSQAHTTRWSNQVSICIQEADILF